MSGLNRIFQAIFGNGNRSPSLDYSNPFLQWFNIGAVLMVALPLLVAVFSRGGEDNDGEGNWWSNLWGNNGDNNDEDDNNSNDGQSWWERIGGDGDDLTLFVYLNALVVFGALVWYGNRVFRRGAFTLPLLTALLVFSNMALLLALVLAASRGDEGGFGLRKLAVLTLALMSFFSFLYFLLTRCRDHENGVTYDEPSSNKESGTMFSNMDNKNNSREVSYNRDRNNNKRKSGIFT